MTQFNLRPAVAPRFKKKKKKSSRPAIAQHDFRYKGSCTPSHFHSSSSQVIIIQSSNFRDGWSETLFQASEVSRGLRREVCLGLLSFRSQSNLTVATMYLYAVLWRFSLSFTCVLIAVVSCSALWLLNIIVFVLINYLFKAGKEW